MIMFLRVYCSVVAMICDKNNILSSCVKKIDRFPNRFTEIDRTDSGPLLNHDLGTIIDSLKFVFSDN